MESLQYRQYPKVVSLDYLYFFLPFPPFFFLFSPPLSVQTTFLIRHRVKEDGDLNILSRTKESSVFGYLLCLFSFFFFFFLYFALQEEGSLAIFSSKKKNITRKCFVKSFLSKLHLLEQINSSFFHFDIYSLRIIFT